MKIWAPVFCTILIFLYVITGQEQVTYLFAILIVVLAASTSHVVDEMRKYNLMTCEKFARLQQSLTKPKRVHQFLPGDEVRIMLQPNDPCREFTGRTGVITHGPDSENGWQVAAAASGLRCVADELIMLTPREER